MVHSIGGPSGVGMRVAAATLAAAGSAVEAGLWAQAASSRAAARKAVNNRNVRFMQKYLSMVKFTRGRADVLK